MAFLNRRNLLLWAIILAALFYVLSSFIPEPPFISLLNGIFFGVSVAVAIVYAPLIWYSIRYSKFDRVAQLSIGIGLVWLSAFLLRAWASFQRFFGDFNTAANSPFVGFFVYLGIIGGALFVTAPGYYEPRDLPVKFGGRNRGLLLGLGAVGGLITSILYIVFGPRF